MGGGRPYVIGTLHTLRDRCERDEMLFGGGGGASANRGGGVAGTSFIHSFIHTCDHVFARPEV